MDGQGGQGPQQYLAFVALITLVSDFQRNSLIFTRMDGQAEQVWNTKT
jgi:hypothetical protein